MHMVTYVVLIALIAFLIGGIYVSRKVRLTEYTSNRSKSTFLQILYTILASLVGGWMFFGLCAIGYLAGVVGMIIGVGYALGLVILGLSIPRIKNEMTIANCDTMDDFVGAKYGKLAQTIVSVFNVAILLSFLAAQFIAMTAFLQVFANIESNWLLYIAIFVVLIYTAMSGFKGVLLTDVWQVYILGIAAIAIFLIMAFSADWNMIVGLDSKYFNGLGFGTIFTVAILTLFPFSLLVRTDLWQRISSAKDARSAKYAFLVSAPILLFFYIILTMVGIFGVAALGKGLNPQTSGFIHFIDLLKSGESSSLSFGANLLLSVLSLGVFSALLSTADTNLNIVSVAISKLVSTSKWKRFESNIEDKQKDVRSHIENDLLNRLRLITLVLGIIAVIISAVIPDIVNLIVGAGTAVVIFLPAVCSILFIRRNHKFAAIGSIVIGLAVLPIFIILWDPKIAFVPAFFASLIIYFIIGLFKSNKLLNNK